MSETKKAALSGKYAAYPEYKDSEVEWLGNVPSHWDVFYGKRIFNTVRKKALETDEQLAASQKFGVIPQALMMQLNDSKVMLALKGTESFRHVDKNNFVISLRSFEGGIEHSNYIGCVSPAYTVLTAVKNIEPKYFKYLLKSAPYIAALQASTDSLRDGKSISFEQFGNIELPLMAVKEQTQIAAFLDHETAKIDTLIEKQQQLIELLKEKRQAMISHAVTKGLNPDAPMKHSGVEWLGDVPEHWGVVQAKYIADITRGAILRPVDDPRYFSDKGDWAYLNISDATKCDKYLYDSKLKLSPLGSTKSARVYPDNVIITASATIGKAFINKIKVCVHDGFIPFCNSKLDINYLYHYLSNPYLYAAMGKSNTQKNIYLDEVKNMAVTFPPQEEQEAIVLYLESIADKYVQLIKEAETAITLMQERRTALISAAVTGKIDVRNWVTPTTSSDTNEAQQEVIA
ncbi:restriction endonuclease subunit S [Photobacterium damselae]|uniref:restriction endonuclease subunit S n=1 Tax=Photobacterium damselae TaxID=38293 RepID=UPI004068331A